MRLDGIHHISVVTGDARANLDFYARTLGLRLVAKTVNQDDPGVYHLFYGDEAARPGAELTFFEYPHAAPGRAGDGMVHTVVWRVASAAALDFWAARLGREGVEVARADGEVRFADGEGLRHALRASDAPDEPLRAVHPEIPAEHALLGFDGVRAYAARPQRSAPLLERLLGARPAGEATWELRGEARGATLRYDAPPAAPGRPSAGTVHHVAWRTSVDEHPAWAARLREAGVPSSGIVDRRYFKAIYFREPSGILFEISDDAPGFAVDSPLAELGRRIVLPPRFEPAREQIEARLTPLPDPRADWPEEASA